MLYMCVFLYLYQYCHCSTGKPLCVFLFLRACFLFSSKPSQQFESLCVLLPNVASISLELFGWFLKLICLSVYISDLQLTVCMILKKLFSRCKQIQRKKQKFNTHEKHTTGCWIICVPLFRVRMFLRFKCLLHLHFLEMFLLLTVSRTIILHCIYVIRRAIQLHIRNV